MWKPKYKPRTAETHNAHIELLGHRKTKWPPHVLFIGHSMVERLLQSPNYNRIAQQYDVFNAGVGGDTISNVLWRIQNGNLVSTCKSPYVLLLVGANDVSSATEKQLVSGVAEIVKSIRHDNPNLIRIIVLGLLPQLSSARTPQWSHRQLNDFICLVNRGLQKLSQQDTSQGGGFQFEDFMSQFLNEGDGEPNRAYYCDCVHLSFEGTQRFLYGLRKVLAELKYES
jgi:platelet-activating factor acetylhydrolase IB subunit beta/gamma